jgi:hypothetical protein
LINYSFEYKDKGDAVNTLDRPEDAEGQFPGVRVASRPSPYAAIVEYIYAAPGGEQWWFWRSSPEPIELITEVDAAADKIVSALGFPR